MVSRKSIAAAFVIAVLLTLVLAALCLAQEEEKPTVTETYQVSINDVGDAHVVDTIKYSKDDYAAIKKVENKKRGFLTRRFTDEDSTGELVDFNTDLNDSTNSVVITYDKPGTAYSTKGDFVYYGGFSTKPKENPGNKFTSEETSTINSEFTLFSDQVFKTTTEVTLPRSATGITYDAEDKALKYQMPAARTLYGFWSEQKVALSVVFGLLTLVFAGMLGFVATRKTSDVVEVSAQGAAVSPAPGPVTGSTAPFAAPPGEKQDAEHRFCEHCGGKLAAGKNFCTNCGAKVD
ncbi:MAG: zinc ribbon domain-containing protein [Candidatus Geothermincolia bacterium]